MAFLFDGREFARLIQDKLVGDFVQRERKHGRKARLITIVDPNNTGGMKYTEMKMRMAEKLGVIMEKRECREIEDAAKTIETANEDSSVDGIMLQLPFPGEDRLIPLIGANKDVDGLREGSRFKPAAIRAVMAILEEGEKHGIRIERLAVVGSRGQVGTRLMKVLYNKLEHVLVVGMDKKNFNSDSLTRMDAIISCTGKSGLITPALVKPGALCIDVGYPRGDFDPAVADRAGFFTPVPGGVGPVTVVMLFANLAEAE